MQSSVGTHCKNAMPNFVGPCPTAPTDSTHHIPRLILLHLQTQPTTSPDSTHCTPGSNPLLPQTQTAASADSKHSTPRLKPQNPLTQTTALPDSNHSTPGLKPQHPWTQHLCTRAAKPLLQPLKHFQISPATVLAINSWHTE